MEKKAMEAAGKAKETKKEKGARERRERIKEMEMARPRDPIDMWITQRFVFEPRASMAPSRRWVVAWDMAEGDYVKEPRKISSSGSKRAYLRFQDTDEAVKWLRGRFRGETKMPPMAKPLPKDRTEEGDMALYDRKKAHLGRIYKALSENQEALGLSDADMAEACLELGDPDRNFARRMVARMAEEPAEGDMEAMCEAAWHALSVTCRDAVEETVKSEMREALRKKKKAKEKEGEERKE